MDKIDQKLNALYRNWQAGYKNVVTLEDCNEVRRFYKPFLEKYESKYRILYQMLQQANRQTDPTSTPSTWEQTSDITPSLVALDDAQTLMRKEWRRGEPWKDIPRQYSTPCEHLTPTQPRYEDMRMDSTLNVTPEGSLNDILTASGRNVDLRESQQIHEAHEPEIVSNQPPIALSGRAEEAQYTSVKVVTERTPDGPMSRHTDIPRRVQHTREDSQEDALVSARHFFAPGNGQNWVMLRESPEKVPITTTGGATLETSTLAITSTAPTTSTTTTSAGIGMGSSSLFLPNGSPSRPTATATCRPWTWVQRMQRDLQAPSPR